MNKFLKQGKVVEKAFTTFLNNWKFSTQEEDMFEHWDVSTEIKFDVKGLKKQRRTDESPDQSIHWVEIKNVNGKDGWLYGDADFISFELQEYWVIVSRSDLVEFIHNNTIKTYKSSPMLRHLYKRKNRKDILTLVSTYDLIYISSVYIKKLKDDTKIKKQ